MNGENHISAPGGRSPGENHLSALKKKGWLELDNAAKLYPAIVSSSLTAVFRITATLRDPVRYNALREAVTRTSARFPYFNVSLGSGLFWHFLEFNQQEPRIQAEEEIPCTAFAITRKNEPLYRILARGNRISVEFLHILTDGSGALEYLKSLLYTYLTLCGHPPGDPGGILLPETPFSKEETEDGYNRFFRKLPPPSKSRKAWHLPFRLNEKPRLRVIRAEMSTKELLGVAREHQVSLTEYLVAVYFLALQHIFLDSGGLKKNRKNLLRIQVPVNMRSKFPTRTLRNFSLFVLPETDLRLGTYTFEEILLSVHHQMQMYSGLKEIARFLSSNVSYEKLFIIRIMPLFIKKMITAAIYRGLASKRFTGTVTNLGQVTLPPEMGEWVTALEFIPPPPNPKVKAGCGIISYNGNLRITFVNITLSTELEKVMLRHLTGEGIRVKIVSET